MSIYVQGQKASSNAAVTSKAVAYPSNNSAGNLLVCLVGIWRSSAPVTPTVSDSANGAWGAAVQTTPQVGGQGQSFAFIFPNCAAGANTVTVSAASAEFLEIIILEYNVPSTVTFDAGNGASTSSYTAGNTLNSGNATATGAPDLVITWAFDASNQSPVFTEAETIGSNASNGIFLFQTTITNALSLAAWWDGFNSNATASVTVTGSRNSVDFHTGIILIKGVNTFTPSARISQLVDILLAEGTPKAQVSQLVDILLAEGTPKAQVSQLVDILLAEGTPKATVTQALNLILAAGTPNATMTQCILFILADAPPYPPSNYVYLQVG